MEKVILYGAGNIFHAYEKIFMEFQDRRQLEIIGIVDKGIHCDNYKGIPVIRLDELSKVSADYIIVTAQGIAADSIKRDLSKIKDLSTKVIGIYKFPLLEDRLDAIDKNQLNVQLCIIKKILSASDKEVMDIDWMQRTVGGYGIYPFRAEDDYSGTNRIVGSRVGMMQRPKEFSEFCVYLSGMEVNTAIEVGVFHGKSSYFMCALLARKNPLLVYNMVDIFDSLDNFNEFHELLPQLKKRIPSTSDDYVGQQYDFVFIDGDHSYDASIRDFKNLGQHANKLAAFHDIYAHEYDNLNGGTVRMWKEVMETTQINKHRVFSEYPDEWMGIGVVEYMR